MIANVIVEVPYQVIMGLLTYASYYYAVVGVQDSERQGLVLLLCVQFFVYASTFAHMVIAAMPDTETASAVVVLLFAMSLTFCGVMQPKDALPGFWIFMYRVSPFTYLVSAMLSTGVAGTKATCENVEYLHFSPPSNQTCQEYMSDYIKQFGGYLLNPGATNECTFCSMSDTDSFLAGVSSYYEDAWRNFGFMWIYIVFNIFAAVGIYWLARVPKGSRNKGSS